MKPGDVVEWHYHPDRKETGTVMGVPRKYGGHWATVEYGGKQFCTLIETCRLSIVRARTGHSPQVKVGGSPSRAVMPTKPRWEG